MIKNLLLLSLSFLMFSFFCSAQKTPKRELRGAWITTHFGLDWPNPSQTPAQQRTALLSILDQHKATGINVIYFQVRNQCDALYPSSIEPWSVALTGVQGRDPGWDPLQFAVDESHKRGLELHAWLNPYRAVATASQLAGFVPGHVAKQHPEWLLNNGSVITLNPALQAVRTYIMSVINDITTRYDVDGIHFDDYFYPPAPFNDDAAYNSDPRGFPATTGGRANWRRDNINIFIKQVYEETMVSKPWVKFGVSPSGIYRNGVSVGGSATAGTEHYSAVYADSKKWLQEKWVDYIAPQVYWHIGFPIADYSKLLPWWNSNAFDRHIYIGMASYKVNMTFPTTGNGPAEQAAWRINTQYPNELRLNRLPEYPNVFGEIHFRSATLIANALSHRDSTRLNIYKRPALPPTMWWRDNVPPTAPSALTATKQPDNNYILNWTKPAATDNEMDKARQFVIYRSQSSVIDINDTANLHYITPTDVNTFTDVNAANNTYYYTVTSLDRLYNESAPSNVTDYLPPVITCPQDQAIVLNSSCTAMLPDYTGQAVVSDDVSSAEGITLTQSPAAGTVITGTGITTVTLTATDASGKNASCSFIVTINDEEAPSLNVPADITVSTDRDECSATVNYETSGADNCTTVSIGSDHPTGTAFLKGTTTVRVTATDEAGNTTVKTFTVTVNDEELPGIICPADITVNTDADVCVANLTIPNPAATDNCSGVSVSGKRSDSAPLTAAYPKGVTSIVWTATDAAGNKTNCTQTITVEDKQAPVITGVSADPSVLFPPNHKMRNVKVYYGVTDNCGPVTTVLTVTSNEEQVSDPEDDEPGSDYQVLDNHRVKLRAERSGSGNGRIYTITITATDASGNIGIATVTVLVPHDQSDFVTSSPASKATEEKSPIRLKRGVISARALPNPSKNYFTLVTMSGSEAPVQLRVTDNAGRVIEKRNNVVPNGTVSLGQRYNVGIYYAEVIQGDKRVVLKLIKQP